MLNELQKSLGEGKITREQGELIQKIVLQVYEDTFDACEAYEEFDGQDAGAIATAASDAAFEKMMELI